MIDPHFEHHLTLCMLAMCTLLYQEWPQHWPTFISDIVSISQTSESICENNMRILRLLSEGTTIVQICDPYICDPYRSQLFRNPS